MNRRALLNASAATGPQIPSMVIAEQYRPADLTDAARLAQRTTKMDQLIAC